MSTMLNAFFTPLLAAAITLSNAGFLEGGIWYSKDPFFAGETVRIYAAIFNSGPDDISGTVEFFDNQKSLGSSDFFVERGGKFSQVWVDWRTSSGQHLIEAVIIKAWLLRIGEKPIPIEFERQKTQESRRLVQEDTDGDKIGNNDDPDDDNDGLSDAEEIRMASKTVANELSSLLPPKTEKKISKGRDVIKGALEPAVNFLEAKREETRRRLRDLAQNPESDQKEKVMEYSYLATLGALSFILKNELVLYLIILIAAYYVLKIIFRRIFKR